MNAIKYLVLLCLVPTALAQKTITVYPEFKSKDAWTAGISAFAPTIKTLWTQDSQGMFLGLFIWREVVYVCAYPTDPQNYGMKSSFESWHVVDTEGNEISMKDVDWEKVKEIEMRSVTVRDDFSTVGHVFYFGRPIPVNQLPVEVARIVLPNAHLAFDFSLKENKIISVWSTKTNRAFEKIE